MTSLRQHELYRTWVGMKERCYDPSHKSFKAYGARGITVCQRWLNSFANFLSDMGERPLGFTLDRKDTNGDYTPENCVWSDDRTQRHTRRVMNEAGCITKHRSKYRVRMHLNGKRHSRIFETLAKAEDYVADCRFEREMHFRLGL